MSVLSRGIRSIFGAAAISFAAASSSFAQEAPKLMENFGHQAATHTAQIDVAPDVSHNDMA